jgi:quinoprotein glucose dehydrogenase
MFEEVNVVEKGANHGWAERDGPERQLTRKMLPETSGTFVEPVHTYSRANGDGICIVGGHVYRGTQIPGLVGHYLFGDWGVGKLWSIPEEGRAAPVLLHARQENEERFNPTQICQDIDGEALVLNHSGVIHKLRQIAPLPSQD